jgi:hypothetical protein
MTIPAEQPCCFVLFFSGWNTKQMSNNSTRASHQPPTTTTQSPTLPFFLLLRLTHHGNFSFWLSFHPPLCHLFVNLIHPHSIKKKKCVSSLQRETYCGSRCLL